MMQKLQMTNYIRKELKIIGKYYFNYSNQTNFIYIHKQKQTAILLKRLQSYTFTIICPHQMNGK